MKKPAPPHADARGLLPSRPAVARLQAKILAWYAANARDLPWRRTRDPYAILVSEMMLQQTQVGRVVPRYLSFLQRFPDLEALAASPLSEILAEWSGLGYNNRAERLHRCALTVVAERVSNAASCARSSQPTAEEPERRRAALPTTPDGLAALPGLGPYTARAVLIFAHNADLAAVDANVRRVLTHELQLPHDLPASVVQSVADALLPAGRSRDWHNALMDYGALVLTSRTTGIAARSHQGPFAGSRRWWRSRILRELIAQGPMDLAALQDDLSLPRQRLEELLTLLERDGLVERRGETVRLP